MKPLKNTVNIEDDYFGNVDLQGERPPNQNDGTHGRFALRITRCSENARQNKPGMFFIAEGIIDEVISSDSSQREGDRLNIQFTETMREYYRKDLARFCSASLDGEEDRVALAQRLKALLNNDFEEFTLDVTITPKENKPEWGTLRYGGLVTN